MSTYSWIVQCVIFMEMSLNMLFVDMKVLNSTKSTHSYLCIPL